MLRIESSHFHSMDVLSLAKTSCWPNIHWECESMQTSVKIRIKIREDKQATTLFKKFSSSKKFWFELIKNENPKSLTDIVVGKKFVYSYNAPSLSLSLLKHLKFIETKYEVIIGKRLYTLDDWWLYVCVRMFAFFSLLNDHS